MSFSTRRGRPKKTIVEKDVGTVELRRKRAKMETSEPLDICLQKGILTEQQHWCGIHLRWLYTLRYGAPIVSCRDIRDHYQPAMRNDDPHWRAQREYEYREAIALLQQYKTYEDVMNLTIFHELPIFLNPMLTKRALEVTAIHEQLCYAHTQLINGFQCLESLWCREAREENSAQSDTTRGHFTQSIETKAISYLMH
jgi:hypothetical protein